MFSILVVPGEAEYKGRYPNYELPRSAFVYRTNSEWLETRGLIQVKEILKGNGTPPNQVQWAVRVPADYVLHWLREAERNPPPSPPEG